MDGLGDLAAQGIKEIRKMVLELQLHKISGKGATQVKTLEDGIRDLSKALLSQHGIDNRWLDDPSLQPDVLMICKLKQCIEDFCPTASPLAPVISPSRPSLGASPLRKKLETTYHDEKSDIEEPLQLKLEFPDDFEEETDFDTQSEFSEIKSDHQTSEDDEETDLDGSLDSEYQDSFYADDSESESGFVSEHEQSTELHIQDDQLTEDEKEQTEQPTTGDSEMDRFLELIKRYLQLKHERTTAKKEMMLIKGKLQEFAFWDPSLLKRGPKEPTQAVAEPEPTIKPEPELKSETESVSEHKKKRSRKTKRAQEEVTQNTHDVAEERRRQTRRQRWLKPTGITVKASKSTSYKHSGDVEPVPAIPNAVPSPYHDIDLESSGDEADGSVIISPVKAAEPNKSDEMEKDMFEDTVQEILAPRSEIHIPTPVTDGADLARQRLAERRREKQRRERARAKKEAADKAAAAEEEKINQERIQRLQREAEERSRHFLMEQQRKEQEKREEDKKRKEKLRSLEEKVKEITHHTTPVKHERKDHHAQTLERTRRRAKPSKQSPKEVKQPELTEEEREERRRAMVAKRRQAMDRVRKRQQEKEREEAERQAAIERERELEKRKRELRIQEIKERTEQRKRTMAQSHTSTPHSRPPFNGTSKTPMTRRKKSRSRDSTPAQPRSAAPSSEMRSTRRRIPVAGVRPTVDALDQKVFDQVLSSFGV